MSIFGGFSVLSYWYRVGNGSGAACEPGEMKMKYYFMSQPVSVSPTAKPHEDGTTSVRPPDSGV